MRAFSEFEQDVRANFLAAKLGDRREDVAEVDVHFVLPVAAFEKYQELIDDVTNGDFDVAAGYNLVLLYTDPEDARRAGTVLFGRDIDGLISVWSAFLEEIKSEPDPAERRRMFNGAHSHFRSSLWLNSNLSDPCASKNLLPRRSGSEKKSFWKKFLH